MSFLFPSPTIQILSDLHLETPLTRPLYKTFSTKVHAPYLLLLGDIGLTIHADLFTFLRNLLRLNRGTRIFYILGNHEAYQTTLPSAISRFRAFESETKKDFGGRFVFLHRDRYDISPTLTILGCTLWSSIPVSQTAEIASRSTDFHPQLGIRDWDVSTHNAEHAKDLAWLNEIVTAVEIEEPNRSIVIATHHSPTCDPRAIDPRHVGSTVSSAFMTDLKGEKCWMSESVKVWAFGHTHFDFGFLDGEKGKLVVSCQRGYGVDSRVRTVVVGKKKGEGWGIVDSGEEEGEREKQRGEVERGKIGVDEGNVGGDGGGGHGGRTGFRKLAVRLFARK